MYLGIHNKFEHNIEFTLTLRKKETVIHLYDGMTLEVEYPAKEEEVHFISSAWAKNFSPSIIVTSHKGSIALYVSVLN